MMRFPLIKAVLITAAAAGLLTAGVLTTIGIDQTGDSKTAEIR